MPEFQPLLDLAVAKWPALTRALAVIGALRLLIKPLGGWLKSLVTRAAERASLSLDPEDDTIIERVLRSRAYRLAAFLLDLFASVKLPVAEDLFKPQPPSTP